VAVTIRAASDADAPAVAALMLRARKAAVPAIPPLVHDDDDVRRWTREVLLASREVWLADEDDGTLVGVLALEGDWIDQLYLEPTHTGRGIGSQLLEHAKARRPDGLDLWAFQSNTGARRFYELHGFVAVDMTDGDNEEGEPDVRYRWPTVRT
jgi:GNAT superfamily N-acetyltransferase